MFIRTAIDKKNISNICDNIAIKSYHCLEICNTISKQQNISKVHILTHSGTCNNKKTTKISVPSFLADRVTLMNWCMVGVFIEANNCSDLL